MAVSFNHGRRALSRGVASTLPTIDPDAGKRHPHASRHGRPFVPLGAGSGHYVVKLTTPAAKDGE